MSMEAAAGGMGAERGVTALARGAEAMPPSVRILLVVGVLGAGLGLASLFRRSPEPATLAGQPRAARHPDAPQVVLGPARSVFSLTPPGPSDIAPPSVAMTDGTLSGPGSTDGFDPPPPMLPLRSPLGSGSPTAAVREQSSSAVEPSQSHVPRDEAPPQDARSETATAATRHRIIDGDTLESIAERFLKDRTRWSDIYQHNRDVLATPGALPIGVELRIPSRDAAPILPSEPPMVPLRRGR
jgi:5'-nucleotidase/UDP-sugar diphosphatase